ncbi:hypothetical protein TRFO_26425 [Tritrichomonas foetus]|uniref:Leucine Rich Repeat family protein n=1 Tax=Tritrichomonas foetus TaxID=1144522 RepID=A0A1J4K3J6_9EUKA|nr:hypothetical protein TRFO_26425 [Tritrichomonas foetus]|eukprot:OHT05755.1 hypothetical protein TRFO_26425 [Tritrichomonas foetus]
MKPTLLQRLGKAAPKNTTPEQPKNRVIRSSSKDLVEIPNVDNFHDIQQMFLSNNRIASLCGIEKFSNLRVLFIADNQISKISEIKFFTNLPIETLNMKGNPITKLPYYQQHAVSKIPTLLFFDDHEVNDQLRAAATSTADFDECRLTLLCINELRIQELEELDKYNGEKSKEWLIRVQRSLGDRTLESFGLDSELRDQNFDKMRNIAFELRSKNENAKCKWGQIYDKIEAIQVNAIDELSQKLKVFIDKLKKNVSQKNSSKSNKSSKSKKEVVNSVSFNRMNSPVTPANKGSILYAKNSPSYYQKLIEITQNQFSFNVPKSEDIDPVTPPTQVHISRQIESSQEYEETGSTFESPSVSNINDETNNTASSLEGMVHSIDNMSPQQKAFIPYNSVQFSQSISPRLSQRNSQQSSPVYTNKISQYDMDSQEIDLYNAFGRIFLNKLMSASFYKWKDETQILQSYNGFIRIYQKRKINRTQRIFFRKWTNRFDLSRKEKSILEIQYNHFIDLPYQPINMPQERNAELLEKTLLMENEILNLHDKIEEAENSAIDYHHTLEESIKNEGKMTNILKKLNQENNSLQNKIKQNDAKYESDIIQFLLDTKLNSDENDASIFQIQKEIMKKEKEIKALKQYITQTKARRQNETDGLNSKLKSAFDVASGFRMEIARLKNETPHSIKKRNYEHNFIPSPPIADVYI